MRFSEADGGRGARSGAGRAASLRRRLLATAARRPAHPIAVALPGGLVLTAVVLRVGADWVALREHPDASGAAAAGGWEAVVALRAIRAVRGTDSCRCPVPAGMGRPADRAGADPLRGVPLWRMLAELSRRRVRVEILARRRRRLQGAIVAADAGGVRVADREGSEVSVPLGRIAAVVVP